MYLRGKWCVLVQLFWIWHCSTVNLLENMTKQFTRSFWLNKFSSCFFVLDRFFNAS